MTKASRRRKAISSPFATGIASIASARVRWYGPETENLGARRRVCTIPPHWHHTRDELRGLCGVPIGRWFWYGYCAWRFDENGQAKASLDGVDRRWDPRCDDA